MSEAVWYYYEAGQLKGPVSEGTLRELLTRNVLPADTVVWREGMSEWQPPAQAFAACAAGSTTVRPMTQVLPPGLGAAHSIKKTPVVLTVLFTAITGGIYYPCWFLTRREAINSLVTRERLGTGVFVVAVVIFSVSLCLSFASGAVEAAGGTFGDIDLLLVADLIDLIDGVISLVAGIMLLVQCFYEHDRAIASARSGPELLGLNWYSAISAP